MNHMNVERFLKVWSEILSDHYGANITITATKKTEDEKA